MGATGKVWASTLVGKMKLPCQMINFKQKIVTPFGLGFGATKICCQGSPFGSITAAFGGIGAVIGLASAATPAGAIAAAFGAIAAGITAMGNSTGAQTGSEGSMPAVNQMGDPVGGP